MKLNPKSSANVESNDEHPHERGHEEVVYDYRQAEAFIIVTGLRPIL